MEKPTNMASIAEIQARVSQEFQIPVEIIQKKGSKVECVIARHTSYYLCYKIGHRNRRELSRTHGVKYWGGWVHYIIKNIENLKDTDPIFKVKLNKLLNSLGINPAKEKIIHQLKEIQNQIHING